MEALKFALVKGLRTFLQTLAGALVALPVISSVADIKVAAPAVVTAVFVALSAGLVAFVQNLAEAI